MEAKDGVVEVEVLSVRQEAVGGGGKGTIVLRDEERQPGTGGPSPTPTTDTLLTQRLLLAARLGLTAASKPVTDLFLSCLFPPALLPIGHEIKQHPLNIPPLDPKMNNYLDSVT